jgi:hypothetical protein
MYCVLQIAKGIAFLFCLKGWALCPVSSSITRACIAAMLYTCIQEVLVSNLGRDTGYPIWGCSCFSLVPPSRSQSSNSIIPWSLPSEYYLMHLHQSSSHWALYWHCREVSHNQQSIIFYWIYVFCTSMSFRSVILWCIRESIYVHSYNVVVPVYSFRL